MKLDLLLSGISHTVISGSTTDKDISNICFDSRHITPGSLFIAMKGSRFDSHDILGEVAKNGISCIIIEKECDIPRQVTAIRVKNSREALAHISAAWFGFPSKKMIMIGVTGTKGKTTTTHMIKSLLEAGHKNVGLIGTNGIFIGKKHISTINTTPESYELQKTFAEMVSSGCEICVMEVSSQGIMLHRSDAIIFDYAIFTNISPDHIGPGEHADFEEYLACKAKIFEQAKTALINIDDDHSEYMTAAAYSSTECRTVMTYGKKEEADFQIKKILCVSENGFVGSDNTAGFPDKTDRDFLVGIPGDFNVYNAMAAESIGYMLGLDKQTLENGLKNIHVNGRMEIAYSSKDYTVIIDYAHNAVSMESLLTTLRAYNPKRLVVVFGCGGNRSKDRRYSMGEIAGKMADFSIITADNSRFEKVEDIIADIRSSIEKTGGQFTEIPDRKQAIFYAVEHAVKGDFIAVIGKGHEDYQEICGVRTHFLDREVVDEAVKRKSQR